MEHIPQFRQNPVADWSMSHVNIESAQCVTLGWSLKWNLVSFFKFLYVLCYLCLHYNASFMLYALLNTDVLHDPTPPPLTPVDPCMTPVSGSVSDRSLPLCRNPRWSVICYCALRSQPRNSVRNWQGPPINLQRCYVLPHELFLPTTDLWGKSL